MKIQLTLVAELSLMCAKVMLALVMIERKRWTAASLQPPSTTGPTSARWQRWAWNN